MQFQILYDRYMAKDNEQTNAQKAIFERIRNKKEECFVSKDHQSYEAYEDHVDSYVL